MKLVGTTGCFDILHPGHIDFLRQARGLGDCLVVGINSDESCRRLKGDGRPINPLEHRIAMLLAVRYVDEVLVFNDVTPELFIRALKPDIYAKSEQYKGRLPEADMLKTLGIEVVFLPVIYDCSTSQIVRRIISNPSFR